MQQWLASAVVGFMTLFGGVNASTTHDNHPNIQVHNGSSTLSVKVSCVAAAVAVRESALDGAVTTHETAVSAAYSDRALALATAYALPSNDAVRGAVKIAWRNFGAALRVAAKNWKGAELQAWSQFRTTVNGCGPAAASISDSNNSESELTGQ